MQRDHVLKKLNFNLLNPTSKSGGGSVSKILATTFLHFCIPFNLICNMALIRKRWLMTFRPLGCVCVWGGGGSAGIIFATILLHLWFPLIWFVTGAKYLLPYCCISWFTLFWCATWTCSEKSILIPGSGGGMREKVEFWPFDPKGVGWGVAGKYLQPYCCLIWYATWLCSEKDEFWPINPIARVRGGGGGYAAKIFASILLHFVIPLILICNMTMFLKSWVWSIDPIPRVKGGGEGVCGHNICYHIAVFVIPFNLICNMTMFWKKLYFELFEPSLRIREYGGGWGLQAKLLLPFDPNPRVRGACGWVWVCRENNCYHAAAFVIPFDLICNMTVFWKSEFWPFDPTSQVHPTEGGTQAFDRKSRLIRFIFIVPLSACKIGVKILTTDWVIAKFKYLTFYPT